MNGLKAKLIWICAALALFAAPAFAKDEIQLQLKWKHAFQFAGYYMAKEKGYYAAAGLDVTILEGSPEHSPVAHVLNGEAHYAVSDTGALLSKVRGKPIQALAAIFQHSPLALAVRKDSGIKTFADLRGKRVMMQQDNMDAVILAAIHKAGLTDADFVRQKSSFDLHDLIAGNTDAFSIYVSDQPNQLKALGVAYRILHPADYDIDFYGDILITSQQEADNHPDRLTAFTAASLKGWNYALEHVSETIDVIQQKYNTQQLSSRQLYFEAKQTAAMILKDEIELGYMSEFRWNRIANTYVALGLIPSSFSLTGFLHQHKPTMQEIVALYSWQLFTGVLLILLSFFSAQALVLRRMVAKRTAELTAERKNLQESEALQVAISQVLEMVVSDRNITEIFEAIIRLFESRYPNMKASILLLHGTKLYKGAAPSLPDSYNDAIEGLEIGPNVGSCGSAAFLKKRVVVENIATDPRWAPYTGLALPLKLEACWSEPIVNGNGEVLGTFAMYYNHPCSPTEKSESDIQNAAKLAGIAIERKQAQEKIRKISRATEQAGESVMITNKDGVIEYVNPSFTKVTGYQAEEVLGKTPRVLKSGMQSAEYYRELWRTVTGGKVWQAAIIDKRKDGTTYPALMTISPIMDDNQLITHYVASQLDVSDQQMLEEKFRQAQKMEALGTLVGGIAHDFNNTLAAMSGNLYLAKMEVEHLPQVLAILDKVEELSFSAADTIKQLLAFARKDMVQMKPFGLTSFMKGISKLHKSTIPENIQFGEEHCDAELIIKGDATQMQQVLINLLNNARDAVQDVENPKISLQLNEFTADENFALNYPNLEGGTFAHIMVKDNGIGISEEDKKHIFEPFFTTKDVGRGTGLGLSMVYGSVQSHGGELVAESSLGKGTTFHIYIPLLEKVSLSGELTEQEKSSQSKGYGETILLVDDDHEILETSRSVLQSVGYKVLEATDGQQAVEVFKTHQHDIKLIVTDIVMPRLGGVQAIAEIRAMQPDIKVIFVTGYDKDTMLSDLSPSKKTMIFSKPYKIEELTESIRKLLN